MPKRKQALSALPVLQVCPPKPALDQRPLLNLAEAAQLKAIYKVLANDTRLRLLHALARQGEMCVTDLGTALGMRPQAISNQLQRLVDRGIVAATRNGNRQHYRITDPCVKTLLDQGWCLIEDARQRT